MNVTSNPLSIVMPTQSNMHQSVSSRDVKLSNAQNTAVHARSIKEQSTPEE